MNPSIYALSCPDTGEIRYIGKANNCDERLKSHIRDAFNKKTPVYSWIKKLISSGKSPVITEICVSISKDWSNLEIDAIKQYRDDGFRLLNVADGGDKPYCSKTVRGINGKKVANSRDKKRWKLLLLVGQTAKWLKDNGRHEIADKLEHCKYLVKSMPQYKIDILHAKYCER